MKKYIFAISLISFCVLSNRIADAQEVNDTTEVEIIQSPLEKMNGNDIVGSVDVITEDDLSHSAYYTLSSALVGQSPAYVLGRIRGFARGGDQDQPLIVIDGLTNRSLSSITVEQVESVRILKDVTAKMLYGNKAANGVIVINTKRGKFDRKKITVSAEYGYRKVKQYPEFVGAADYMKYHNQALMNDGKEIRFTDTEIQMAGTSYKYPDVDYYDMFVNDNTAFQKVDAQLTGGNEDTRYFLNLGYIGEDGLEKVGDKRRNDLLNVRSNLDYEVNDVISVNLDIAGQFHITNGNHVNTNQLFSTLSSQKPNDYPIFISDQPNVDSLGTSDIVGGGNLYGDMVYSGYRREMTSFAQTNIGMQFDFNKYINGLTGGIFAAFDINNYIAEGKNLSYRTLKPALTPNGGDTLIVNGVYNPKGNEQRLGDNYFRNMGGNAYLTYDKFFGDHGIYANLIYRVENKTVKTFANDMVSIQGDKQMNVGFQGNYSYQSKYYLQLSSSYMGSNRFHPDNRWKLFNSFGAAYVVSEEDFMQNQDAIDYLKLKASYGTIGYDQSFDHLLYNNYYKYWAGSYPTGVKNSDQLVGTEFIQNGNKDLTFEESTELNVGISLATLNNKLAIDAEYFTEERSGMPTLMQYAIPLTAGTPDIVDNYNSISNQGYEISAQFSNAAGDFSYSLGGSFTHFVSEWKQYDELNDFAFQNTTGTVTDAIWGYVTDGFYTTADDVANWGADGGVPLTSSLGTVIPGDLKLVDLTDQYEEYNLDDNVINYYDRKVIGNSRPRYVYDLNLSLQYKNLSFYALGQGVGGCNRMTTWPNYYTNVGNAKYSKFVYDHAVPTFNDEGEAIGLENNNYSLPRLTTENANHSYQSSTFFLRDGSYFKLRTVELKYRLPKSVSSAMSADRLDVYVRADELLTISDEKDLDPESPAAGLTVAPSFATVSLGLKLVF